MRCFTISGLAAAAAIATAGPTAAQIPLPAGTHFSGKLAEGDPQRSNGQHFLCFRMAGAPGDRIAAVMSSTAFDSYLMTVPSCDPDAEALSVDDDGGKGVDARLVAVLGDAPLFLRATAGGFGHGHGAFSLRLERTQDFPIEVCFENDLARRQDALRTCERLAGDDDQPVRVRAVTGGRVAAFALERQDYASAVLQESRTLGLPDLPDELAADAYLRRAQGLRGLEQYAEALEDLAEAERLLGERNAGILMVRSLVLSAMGDAGTAAAALDQAIALEPDNAQAWAIRGGAAYERGEWGKAIADITEALRRDPGPAQWYYYRGRAHDANGDDAAAIADLSEALRRSPDMAEAWYVRGQLLEIEDRLEDALSDYGRALALMPDADDVLNRRASVNLTMRRFDAAIADADRAAELSPDNAGYHNQRCWTRAVADRDLEVARAACDRSLALAPNTANVLDSRALVAFRQSRFSDAWADYDAAFQLDSRGAGFLYGRGLAALKLGRRAEGQADIVAALGMDAAVAEAYAEYGLRPE